MGLPRSLSSWYTGHMGIEQTGQTNMRVLVLSDESLFSLGVQNLLRQYSTLEIRSCESDLGVVLACLQTFQPHVVVLDSDQQHSTTASEWMHILRSRPGIKLLGLSLRDNTICIYRGETQQVTEVADLLRAIEHLAE
jgi:DNA-binding NarL/FixJ family response regulator